MNTHRARFLNYACLLPHLIIGIQLTCSVRLPGAPDMHFREWLGLQVTFCWNLSHCMCINAPMGQKSSLKHFSLMDNPFGPYPIKLINDSKIIASKIDISLVRIWIVKLSSYNMSQLATHIPALKVNSPLQHMIIDIGSVVKTPANKK